MIQCPFGPLFLSLQVLLVDSVAVSILPESQVSCHLKTHPLEIHQLYSIVDSVAVSILPESQVSCHLKTHPLEIHQLYSKDEISLLGVEVCVCLSLLSRTAVRAFFRALIIQ